SSGRIILLENQGFDADNQPKFELREVDDRHGASHVPTVDFNGDGHLDFVALISQDHEVVELFLNDGKGSFQNQVIWRAPDPAYGFSGIELVDLDQDDDLDILLTNGDSFDRGPKPYHSIQWLENVGDGSFQHHHLCEMPGVLTAKAADVDGDGDLDIVAASLLADSVVQQIRSHDTTSVVLLTQTEPGVFRRSKLEGRLHQHISLETADFNQDGKVDIAVGNFLRQRGADQPELVIWWNES
ncbi:MAG: VCBS repeat-containing protein, partial [Pirellulales bacterium]|nr:VCBS repeat-containing protein [Pirellulales bacterium]